MSLLDKKVSEALLQTGVVSAPDKLTGTAAENKAVFDRLIRAVTAACLNPVLEELAGEGGAAAIGTAAIGDDGASGAGGAGESGGADGTGGAGKSGEAGEAGESGGAGGQIPAGTVYQSLKALKALCDDRYTKEEAARRLEEATAALLERVELGEDGVWVFTARGGRQITVDNAMAPFLEAVRQAREAAQEALRAADRATEVAGGDFATRSEIKNKADRPLLPVAGNLVEMDENGNLRDAGRAALGLATMEAVEKRALASRCVEAVLLQTDWQGERRPFTQKLSLAGMGEKGFACMSPLAGRAHWDVCRRAGLRVERQEEAELVFAADGEKPNMDLPIVLLFVG